MNTRFLVFLPLFASSIAAQNHDAEPYLGSPAFVTVDSNTRRLGGGAAATNEVYWKDVGFRPPRARTSTPGPIPDFRFSTLFDPGMEIDAISFGLDDVYVDESTGQSNIPADHWVGMQFVVDSSTTGATGTVIYEEAKKTDGPGADIFSHILQGSSLSPPFMNRTERVSDNIELNFVRSPAGLPQIQCLDSLAWVYELDQDITTELPGIVAGTALTVYFSVTDGTKSSIPSTLSPQSGATILKRDWTQTGGWGAIDVFLTPTELNLLDTDDIDALAVDYKRGNLLFSTDGNLAEEIWFATGWKTDDPPVTGPYKDATGKKIDYDEEGGTSGVKGVCVDDPGSYKLQSQTTPGVANQNDEWKSYIHATPMLAEGFLLAHWEGSAAGFRGMKSGRPMIYCTLAGLGPAGTSATTCTSFLLLTIDFYSNAGGSLHWRNINPAFLPPYGQFFHVGAPVTRNLSSRLDGDPIVIEAPPMPRIPSPLAPDRRCRFFFVTIDNTGLHASNQFVIRL